MSDYGGDRFGRGGGGRGRGSRGGGFAARGRGRSDYESDEHQSSYRKTVTYENNDDWDENPSSSVSKYDGANSCNKGGGGKGYGGYGRQDRNYSLGNDDQDNENDDNGHRVGGRASTTRGGRNFGNDGGYESRSSNFGRFGGDDGNRRARGDDNQRGRGRGRRGGRNDNDSENGFGRRRNEDNSPSRSDDGGGRHAGGRRAEGNTEDKDEKPRERYIPPDPTDDEEIMFGTGITSGINFSKYDNIRVKVSGENAVQPINSFEEAGLRELIYKNIRKSGYTIPTPIQKYALPTIMMGRDLMACAQTGSGKTAAFLIPIINTLLESPSELIITSTSVEPQAVIMTPTRELTIQIFNEARKFAHGSIIKVAMAYGGTASYHQASVLMRGCHILVATPGRLNDFVSRDKIKFSSVRYFVMDEADRMLDMGFKPEIEKMLLHESMVPVGQRQTMMFSATFPEDIQRLAQDYLNNYLFIAVGIVGGACADVQQVFNEVSRFDKKEKLKEILSVTDDKDKTLVFVEQKRTADFIAAFLSENGFPTTSIHGDRLQSQRELALNDFKTGRMPTLVATAVAARGLDIKNVCHVINYDLPSTIEEYVHRIGRTGRVGNRGKATSFYDPNQDSAIADQLVTILTQTNQPVPEFLSSSMGGVKSESINSGSGYSNVNQGFGGRDVRRGPSQSFQSDRNPQQQEEEEEW